MLAIEAVLHNFVGIGCNRILADPFVETQYFQNFVLEKLYLLM